MSTPANEEEIVIIGAGLSGTMMGALLAKRGKNVTVIEGRPDWRGGSDEGDLEAGKAHLGQLTDARTRSINLALSYRGILALEKAGVYEKVKPHLIPCRGRYLHHLDGHTSFVPYGKEGDAIYSVDRRVLNDILLEKIESFENTNVLFDSKVTKVDKEGKIAFGKGSEKRVINPKHVIGADGAFSVTRRWMMRHARVDFSQTFLEHGYKELCIPPTAEGEFALENPESIHIWPRNNFMMIALPNPDKSFTVTLFAPFDGPIGLESALKTPEKAQEFFEKWFPDVIAVMPTLYDDAVNNPASPLLTVRCNPWNYKDKMMVVGDAAHAIVPFYGQGMNSGFEDCYIFDGMLDSMSTSEAIQSFGDVRRPMTNALAQVSLDNYLEMRALSAQTLWNLEHSLELGLYSLMPNTFIPLYPMVQFTNIPFDEAVRRNKKQKKIIRYSLWATTVAAVAGAVNYFYPDLKHKAKDLVETHLSKIDFNF